MPYEVSPLDNASHLIRVPDGRNVHIVRSPLGTWRVLEDKRRRKVGTYAPRAGVFVESVEIPTF